MNNSDLSVPQTFLSAVFTMESGIKISKRANKKPTAAANDSILPQPRSEIPAIIQTGCALLSVQLPHLQPHVIVRDKFF